MRKCIHIKTVYLLHLFLLLIQGGGIHLQQRGPNTHRQVVGVHLVELSTLKDVMEDADQMLQEEFVVHWELVYHPGRQVAKRGRKGKKRTGTRLSWRFF